MTRADLELEKNNFMLKINSKDWFEHATTQNIEKIVKSKEELSERLKEKKQIRIKFGVDVTNPLLHIGNGVNLWKMREFQEQGHKVIFLIGDFTSLIGDPTGKSKTRPQRTAEQIEQDAKEYISQATKILLDDPKVFEVRRNSEWYSKMPLSEFLKLCAKITHGKLIQRDMFQDRIKNGQEIFMHEMIYPILQGYDSVMLESDLTVIGSDQLFNELLGRHYQEIFKQKPQVIMTTIITPGIDGKEKQSKSLGNFIAITDTPQNKYGKIMSMPDNLIITYYKVYTFIDPEIINQYQKQLEQGENPRNIKAKLAKDLVALYHGKEEAEKAEQEFNQVFQQKGKPTNIPEIEIKEKNLKLIDLISQTKQVASKTEARRLIEQKAVKINDQVNNDWQAEIEIKSGDIIQIGRRKFIKIK